MAANVASRLRKDRGHLEQVLLETKALLPTSPVTLASKCGEHVIHVLALPEEGKDKSWKIQDLFVS